MSKIKFTLLCLLTLLFQRSFAEAVEVISDTMLSVEGNLVFDGNVSIETEEISLVADKLRISENSYEIHGNPATLIITNNKIINTAQGNIIEYYVEEAIIKLPEGGTITTSALNVAANSIVLDLKKDTMLALGNVRIKDGTIIASANKVTSKDSGNVIVLDGKPATVTLRNKDKAPLTATANIIEYNQTDLFVHMLGNANAQLDTQSIAGEKIEYSIKTQSFSVEPDKTGRVRTTIQTL